MRWIILSIFLFHWNISLQQYFISTLSRYLFHDEWVSNTEWYHRTLELPSSFRLSQADSRIRGNDRFFLLQNINRQWDLELSSIKTTQEMVLGIYFKSRPKIRTKLGKCHRWSETYHSLHFSHNDLTTKFRWVRRLASSPVEDSIEDCQKFNFEVLSFCSAVWAAKL